MTAQNWFSKENFDSGNISDFCSLPEPRYVISLLEFGNLYHLKSLQMVIVAMKLKDLLLGKKVMTNLDSIFKQRHYFANKGPSSQGHGFSSGHVWM